MKAVPFCDEPYGCAFDEIMIDPNAVYTKIDDDIIFIKDGSFEHLVYQVIPPCIYSLSNVDAPIILIRSPPTCRRCSTRTTRFSREA